VAGSAAATEADVATLAIVSVLAGRLQQDGGAVARTTPADEDAVEDEEEEDSDDDEEGSDAGGADAEEEEEDDGTTGLGGDTRIVVAGVSLTSTVPSLSEGKRKCGNSALSCASLPIAPWAR